MTKIKMTLVNSTEVWSIKKRYKVNTVVVHDSVLWQNATGINTEPGNDDNWVNVSGKTDNIENNSLVEGETATEALDTLNAKKLNLIDAKQFGAVADGVTDDTTILQSYLDSIQGLYIFPKGIYSVSGLDVNSDSELHFEPGAVLSLRDNSDRPVLQNKNFSVNTDKNIFIYGLEIEGNEANQIKFGVTAPYTGEPTSGVRFFGVENLKIIGAKINKARTYGIWISRAKNVIARDIEFNQSLATIDNQDGIHFNGLCYNLDISNIRGVTNDDMIALNTNDVAQGVNVSLGEIVGATIKDVVFDNNLNGIRLLSAGNLLDQIYISNLSGNVRDNVVAISSYTLGTANFGSIYIDGVNVDTNTPYNVMGEYGGYILVNDKIDYLKISNIFRKTGADARPTVRIQSRADISKLVIDNVTDVINQSLTTYYPEISFENGSVVEQAFISNIRLMNGVFPNGYCIGATGSVITRLHLTNIYAEQIGYGLYLDNTDIGTLFTNSLTTNYIRYPFYLVNDSDISFAVIISNEWVYSAGTPGVYNILDTSSITISGFPTAQKLIKWDDDLKPANSSISETLTETSIDQKLAVDGEVKADYFFAPNISGGTVGSPVYEKVVEYGLPGYSSGIDGANSYSDNVDTWLRFYTNESGTKVYAITLKGKNVLFEGTAKLKSYTVATLPAGGAGDMVFCTDLIAPTYMATAVGGGTIGWKLLHDGVSWKVG